VKAKKLAEMKRLQSAFHRNSADDDAFASLCSSADRILRVSARAML
jgi:hypothetical protein